MSDLRPCPFCGGKAIYDKSYKIDCYNGCTSVEAWADNRTGSNKEIVKEKWNSRPMLDEAVELLGECRSDIETVNIYLKRIAKYQEGEIGPGMMSDEEKKNARKWQKMLGEVLEKLDNKLEVEDE
jgi:hypothetical protein